MPAPLAAALADVVADPAPAAVRAAVLGWLTGAEAEGAAEAGDLLQALVLLADLAPGDAAELEPVLLAGDGWPRVRALLAALPADAWALLTRHGAPVVRLRARLFVARCAGARPWPDGARWARLRRRWARLRRRWARTRAAQQPAPAAGTVPGP